MSLLRSLYILLLVAYCAHSFAAGDSAEEVGRALAQAVYDAPHGDDFAATATMILTEKGRKPRVRRMLVLSADRGPAERWSLTRFLDPADVRGVAILTKDHPGDESEQWLYLPALDRVRRISSSRKGGRFVGSDLYYEDLRDREVGMDRHRYKGKGKLGKLVCKILESTPLDPGSSVYTKRVSWVHPRTLIPLRVDLYRGDAKVPEKRLRVKRIKRIQGFWTVMDSTMTDLESGHVTRIKYSRVKYNQKIPDQLFTSRSLADERAGLAYSPRDK